jgi:hypothetical protein
MTNSFSPEFLKYEEEKDYDKLIDRSREMLMDINVNPDEAIYWLITGLTRKRKIDQVFIEYKKNKTIIKEKIWHGRILNRIGSLCFEIGEIKQAILNLNKALEFLSHDGTNEDLGRVYNNLGIMADLQGNLSLAENYYRKAIDYKLKIGRNSLLAASYLNYGIILFQLGDHDKAIELTINAYNIFMSELHSFDGSILSAFELVKIYLLLQDKKNAKQWLEILKDLSDKQSKNNFAKLYPLALALYLKTKNSLIEKGQSINLLEQFLNDPLPRNSIIILAIKNLLELKLDEFKINQNNDLLKQINDLTEDGIQLTKSEKLFPAFFEFLVIQAKLFEVKGLFKEAKSCFDIILETIRDEHLNHFDHEYQRQFEDFKQRIDRIGFIYKDNVELFNALDTSEVIDYLKMVKDVVT